MLFLLLLTKWQKNKVIPTLPKIPSYVSITDEKKKKIFHLQN